MALTSWRRDSRAARKEAAFYQARLNFQGRRIWNDDAVRRRRPQNTKLVTWKSLVCPYQALLAQEAEEEGVADLPQVLEAHGLELCILYDVLQLVVEELEDPWRERKVLFSCIQFLSIVCLFIFLSKV